MFDPRVGWIGTLEVMKPGLGYMLFTAKTATLTYPNGTIFKDAKIPTEFSSPAVWNNDLGQFEGNMSLVAKLDLSLVPELKVNSQMVLGAFIDGENHGLTSPVISSGIGFEPFSYKILVRADDQKGGTVDKFFTINIKDVNEAPTGVSVLNTKIPVSVPANTVVSELKATDEDAGDVHTFELVAGDGTNDRDNSKLSIDGKNLKSTQDLIFWWPWSIISW